jgi:epoxyqueuosine reductase
MSEIVMAFSLKERIAREANALGFQAVRFAGADPPPGAGAALDTFLADGRQGDMAWLAANAERRKSPRAIWPDVKSIIILGMSYGPERDPLQVLGERSRGAISVYAQGADYHDVIKSKLKVLAARVQDVAQGEVKVFVDTAAVMEKPIAAKAGLGWQGKHTNLVSRDFGSWLFLGAILTTMPLPADAAVEDSCGTCTACLDVCPTKAFPAPYRLDARRCISYLTIEHDGPIPREFRAAIGNRIYGCDDCLAVCPWNKFARRTAEIKLAIRDDLRAPPLAELAKLDDSGFRKRFSASAIKRIGRDRFLRNVMIAIGNSSNDGLVPAVERAIEDGSAIVRGAAVWALSRLSPSRFAELVATRPRDETDAGVRKEWEQ